MSRVFFDVPRAGVEPARPKTQVFETCVSTNSTTWAGKGCKGIVSLVFTKQENFNWMP